jgi:hypothetical protein
MNVVMKIHEEEKDANGAALVSAIYDDVFREMIARRGEAKNPGLDFDAEFSKVDKNILEACKARIDTIIRARPHRNHIEGAGHIRESHLAKQTAAAELAAKKAENATRAFEEARRRVEAGQFNPDLPRRDAKRHIWMLGKVANARQTKLSRRREPDEEFDEYYEEEPEEEHREYEEEWEYVREPSRSTSKGSKGWKKGGSKGSNGWKGSKGWKGGKGWNGKAYR